MKRRQRKHRNLFPKTAPKCPFGVFRADINLPMDEPNALCRYVYKEVTPSTPAVIRKVPKLRWRILRWMTPEIFERNNGRYFRKKDRRYYPIVDTKSKNPFRRYGYYYITTREKRFYSEKTRLQVKPYTLRVIDLLKAEPLPINGELPDPNDPVLDLDWEVTHENVKLFREAFIVSLKLADERYPLQFVEDIPSTDGSRIRGFQQPFTSETVLSPYDHYFYETRLSAFLNNEHGRKRFPVDKELGYDDITYLDDIPYGDYNRPLPTVATSQFQLLVRWQDGTYCETLSEINSRLRLLGLVPKQGYDYTNNHAPEVAYGITGPQFLEEKLGMSLYLHMSDFDYSKDMLNNLSERIPFSDLTGTIGYASFLQEPLRGANLGQFLGELPESVKSFADILSTAIKIARAIKRGDLKDAFEQIQIGRKFLSRKGANAVDILKSGASVDLFIKFGIMPFLEDLKMISDLGASFGDIAHGLGSKRRIRHNWTDMPWGKSPLIKEIPFDLDVTVQNHTFKGTGNYTLSFVTDVEYGAEIKVKDPFAFFFESTGLNSILGTAWELLPLSFVVDWFVDVGSVIEHFSDIELNSFDILNGYTTFTTICTVDERLTVETVDDIDVNYTVNNQYKIVEVARSYFDPTVSLSINGKKDKTRLENELLAVRLLKPQKDFSFSPAKLGTSAELIIQRLRS